MSAYLTEVDFVSFEIQIVIEMDGGQHAKSDLNARDRDRDAFLRKNGFKVLRFWDNEIFENLSEAIRTINAFWQLTSVPEDHNAENN